MGPQHVALVRPLLGAAAEVRAIGEPGNDTQRELLAVEDVAGGAQGTMELTFEVDGAAKPSCVAEVLYRYYA